MSQQDNDEGPWAFTLAQNFSQSFNSYLSDELLEDESIPRVADYNPRSQVSKGLGDFDRLFAFCGKPTSIPTRPRSESSSATDGDKATPPSSAPDEPDHFAQYVAKVKGKGVRWTDQEGTADLAKSRSRSTRRSASESASVLDPTIIKQLLDTETDPSGLESDNEDEDAVTPTPSSSKSIKSRKSKAGVSNGSPQKLTPKKSDKSKTKGQPSHSSSNIPPLLPASVIPPRPPPDLHIFREQNIIYPLHTLDANQQKAKLIKDLARKFPSEATVLKDPYTILREGGNIQAEGIHVFVDLSNIVIGFCEQLKINRIQAGKMRQGQFIKRPPFSFRSLSIILERGRPVARRVLVGSTSNTQSEPYGPRDPPHISEALRLGYERNVLERVAKAVRMTTPKKRNGTGTGYATSGYSSASETQMQGRLKMQEQGVDEILQMKMLESLIDSEPSTIVLASGDAAEAEYSGGFLKNVERALQRGWKVEVVSWSRGLSSEYRSSGLLKRWPDMLSILDLDSFCEEMLGLYPQKKLPDCKSLDELLDRFVVEGCI